MAIRLVLADFDGTLADSMPFWAALPVDTLRGEGIPLPDDMAELVRAIPMYEIAGVFAERYPQLGSRDDLYVRWMERMRENYSRRIALKAGARELLGALQERGVKVCVVTATAHSLLDGALEGFGLLPWLDGVITEEDAGGSKRTAAPYALCRERFGAEYGEMLLLEDSLPNLRGGKAMGLAVCGVYDESMAPLWPTIRAEADLALVSLEDRQPLLAML